MEIVWLHWLHLMSAIVWVGGALFLPLVLTPVLRHHIDQPERRLALMSAIGRRFRVVGWIALAVLVLTGLRRAMLAFAGAPDFGVALTTTAYGRILMAKVLLVVILLGVQAMHDFYLGPRLARRAGEPSPGLARARAATIGIAIGSLLLALVIVALAVHLRFR